MENKISPKNVNVKVMPGFMELLPAEQILFDRLKGSIVGTYESFGFVPLDTPVIERSEILLAKAGGETEKQIYRFQKGDEDLSLRFDLTVPLARYVSAHLENLSFPFRRYHIGKVYRGERAQKGRYREFYQCDIDIIGRNSLSLAADAELVAVIKETFSRLNKEAGVCLPPIAVRVSNRKLLSGFISGLGLSANTEDILRIIDKVDKISQENVKGLLVDLTGNQKASEAIISFISIQGWPKDILPQLKKTAVGAAGHQLFTAGLEELETVMDYVAAFGAADICRIDMSIARGLDYYTGTVYETNIVGHEDIGSVCSGGRYDNLAENYTSQPLPGVGLSIGLTRLFSRLLDLGLIKSGAATTAKAVIVPYVDIDLARGFKGDNLKTCLVSTVLKASSLLRASGISNVVCFEGQKAKERMANAGKTGARYAVIIGADELKGGFLTWKDMESSQNEKHTCSQDELSELFKDKD